MKNAISIILIILISACSNRYGKVLDGLEKNYVLLYDKIESDLFYEYYQIDSTQYEQIHSDYLNSVSKFFTMDVQIIDYLLKHENVENELCDWIETPDPYKSTLENSEVLTKAQGALILLDNYLRPEHTEKIVYRKYIDQLSYKLLRDFYVQNKNDSITELRSKYKTLLRDLSIN